MSRVITETGATFSDVYLIEQTDKVLGGDSTGDIANKQAHALIQRDNYLLSLLQNNDHDIILSLLSSYTPGDVMIMQGCAIAPTIPGSSTITAGIIFYGTTLANAKLYRVAAATVVTTSGQTLVFKIDTTVDPNVIYLTNAATGTGIADYSANTVKNYFKSEDDIIGVSNYFEADFVPENSTGSVVFAIASYIKKGNIVHLQMQINVNVSAVGSGNHWYNIKIIPPSFAKCKKSLSFLIGTSIGGLGTIGFNSDSNGDIFTNYDNSVSASIANYSHMVSLNYEIE